jgi:microcin C transport system permease protein
VTALAGKRDYPVVLASVYLLTLIGLGIKLLADLLYVLVDPRVQFGQAAR